MECEKIGLMIGVLAYERWEGGEHGWKMDVVMNLMGMNR